MKKTLMIITVLIMVVMASATVVCATVATTVDEIYALAAAFGMTSSDAVKLERVLTESDLTDVELASIVTKAENAKAVMTDAGVTSYSELTEAQKSEVTSIANEAASIAGVTLSISNTSVEVYKDGTLLETVTSNDGTLSYTGSNLNILAVISLVVAIALVATVLNKKNK